MLNFKSISIYILSVLLSFFYERSLACFLYDKFLLTLFTFFFYLFSPLSLIKFTSIHQLIANDSDNQQGKILDYTLGDEDIDDTKVVAFEVDVYERD